MNFNATFFGQLIAFAVFVWFCMRFIWPLLLKTIEEREERIADGLAAAEQGKQKLAEAKQHYQATIDEGKQKAVGIVDQAKRRAEEIVEEAKQQAKIEGERQFAAVKSEIDRAQEQARQELRQQVAALVVAGAAQVLMREVDQAVHEDILAKVSGEL